MYRVVETACPARPQLPAAPGATSRLAHDPFIRNMSSVIALLLEFQVFFWKHSWCACVRQDDLLNRQNSILDFSVFNFIFQNYIELFAKCGWDSFPWRLTSNPSGFNFSKLVPSRQGSRGARDAIFGSKLFLSPVVKNTSDQEWHGWHAWCNDKACH